MTAGNPPVKVNPYDQNAVKQLLDDITIETILAEGYDESTYIMDYKLIVGCVAILLAMTSHFFPQPFPDNLLVIKLCCVGYICCTVLLQLIGYYWEKDYILITKSKKGRQNAVRPGVVVSTGFPKNDDMFVVCIGTAGEPESDAKTITESIGKWFDKEGYIHEDLFVPQIKSLLASVEKSD
eukprot:TRINITY_DN9596_c0_g1_i1.p1 TRINITY_DN9596_c0_g1~~TRINITY_DN9596_c0_g1_i1.p1  ORF type:complete len:181 (+),score=26.31 TRINITY_DN9596_c0_g1_i1:103-645(+)